MGKTTELVLPAVAFPASPAAEGFVAIGFSIPEKRIRFDRAMAGELVYAARSAADTAYAPYSKFSVGAALVMADDPSASVFTGANVENSSYSGTICAERTALAHAAASGFRQLAMIAVSCVDALDGPAAHRSPCGICRQVIREFADEETLILLDTAETDLIAEVLDIHRLLPHGFTFRPPEEAGF